MKSVIALLPAVFITGCAVTVPVAPPKLPDMPSALREPCEALIPIEKKPAGELYAITDILRPTIENYRRAIECKVKHQTTVEWYDDQRTIYNGVGIK